MTTDHERRPNLFILGAAKCGTTSMYEYLSGHPQVFMSQRKEPRYFSPDLAGDGDTRRLRHPQDLPRYLALFAGAGRAQRIGEGTVQYLYSRDAPGLIHAFDPNAYLIVMFRDPVEMMYSLHAHYVAAGNEPLADFAAAVAAEEPRRAGGSVNGVNSSLMVYSDRARFGEQLARWYEVFGRERIHVTVLDDLKRDPAAEFRRVLEFLQVDPAYVPDSFAARNASHVARSNLLRSALRSELPRRVRWQLFPALFGEAGALRVSGRLRRLMVRQVNRKQVDRPALDASLRTQLQQQLAGDVALLSELLGRDMAALWWGGQTSPVEAHDGGGAHSGGAREVDPAAD